ncbi:MAG: nucleoside triphosphate pyrophosphohydrolase [Ruminococcaceae bacterium]|nr:nucleoside triphosphate pyrophosphohydrolase [Oscillospiraceae bacterium]
MDVKTLLQKENYTFDDLCSIMAILRSENGCPWDREQDHKTIRNNLLEETYEAIEGIDNGDSEILKEELGDVLLQVVFHARIAQEENDFDIDDVADGVCKKLILRHPHIFADVKADTSEQVLKNWDEIKKTEKHQKSATDTLRSVSTAMPSLMRAGKLQSKAAKVGFTYANTAESMGKVDEEYTELVDALKAGDPTKIEEEFGDLLFAVTNAARLSGVNAEEALFRTNEKFIDRFSAMETTAKEQGSELCELSVNKLQECWNKAKK